MSSSNRESIRVVCRLRPENKLETEGGNKKCVKVIDDTVKIKVDLIFINT